MAHYSKINENNIVTHVLAVPDSQEHRGNDYLNEIGQEGTWIKTSCNTKGGVHVRGGVPLRKNYGIPGYIYDSQADAFHAPQPYPSWTLNQDTFEWEPPIAWPEETGIEYWDEPNQRWINI
jgi:hypothetical protein